jgi:quinoprotein glucose dehydrogenase
LPTGVFNIGGAITTSSGLIFIGAAIDDYIRAFDVNTGEELWKSRLPAGGQATPVSYVTPSGRQFVVISAGGHGALATKLGDYIVAYALPRP